MSKLWSAVAMTINNTKRSAKLVIKPDTHILKYCFIPTELPGFISDSLTIVLATCLQKTHCPLVKDSADDRLTEAQMLYVVEEVETT